MIERQPQIREVGIIALTGDTWSDQWQTRHHVLTRLAGYFHVVWINPASHLRTLTKRTVWLNRAEVSPVSPAPGFHVYTPEPWLPVAHRPRWLADLTLRGRLHRARNILRQNGAEKTILYIWKPEFHAALNCVPHDLSCYHIDDEYSYSSTQAPISRDELRLLNCAGHVFIHSPGLFNRKGGFNQHTSFIPNGVDYELHSCPANEPADLLGIPRPRVGYTGWLKRQLDWNLLLQLSRRHPEWSFVFAGAAHHHEDVESLMSDLKKLPNVHFLGSKSSSQLARYPQHFDVCLMPYVQNHYTNCIYPLKLHEYLASGQPVVATPVRSLQEFSNVLYLAESAEEWSAAITAALSPAAHSLQASTLRRQVARKHDWAIQVGKIASTFAERLGPEVSAKLRPGALQGTVE